MPQVIYTLNPKNFGTNLINIVVLQLGFGFSRVQGLILGSGLEFRGLWLRGVGV